MGFATLSITMAAFFRVPILPEIGGDLSMSTSQLGLLTTLFGAGRLAADLPAGRLADRVGPRSLMAGAALTVALGSLILGAAQNSTTALVAAVVLGVGSSLTNTTGHVFFATRAPIEQRGTAVSLFVGLMLAGQAFGPTLGGGLSTMGGWRFAELSAGLGLLAVAAVTFDWRQSDPSPAALVSKTVGDDTPRVIPLSTKAALSAVPFALFGAAGMTIQTLVPVIGADDLGLSTGKIGLAVGAGGVVRVLGTIIGGQISDRRGRKTALVPTMLIGAAGAVLLGLGSGSTAWLLAILLMAGASHAVSAAATMIADLSSVRQVGKNLGTFRFVGDIGLILGPAAGARLFESFGAEAALLPLAAVITLVALAVAVVVPETLRHGARRDSVVT